MTLLYFAAIYLFARIVVEHDEDWKALPLLFLFIAALSLLVPVAAPEPFEPPCLVGVCNWRHV